MDRITRVGQTACMLKQSLAVLLVACASCAAAQQTSGTSAKSAHGAAVTGVSQESLAKMAQEIRASYYHPDDLVSMECDVNVDWDSFISSMKLQVSDERKKGIEGLKLHARAVRGQDVQVRFDWTQGEIDTKAKTEGGLQQMMSGFYQMYWPMLATSMIAPTDKLTKLEKLADGSRQASIASGNVNLVITIDKAGAPTRYDFDSAMMKGFIAPTYVATVNPTPGDLRRISELKVDESIGQTKIVAAVSLDYQPAGDFFVPQHVTFDIPGAYLIKLEFTGCSASRVAVTQ